MHRQRMENNHNMQGQFQALYNSCETLLQQFFDCLYILKPRATYSFQAAANAFSAVVGDANNQLSALKESINQATLAEDKLATM